MYQKLPVDGFDWKKIFLNSMKFKKNYDEKSDVRYIFEVDVESPKRLHNFHNDLPFLPKRMKIKKCHQPCMQSLCLTQLCFTHKNFKTGIKSWIDTTKGASSNSI